LPDFNVAGFTLLGNPSDSDDDDDKARAAHGLPAAERTQQRVKAEDNIIQVMEPLTASIVCEGAA
jgi:hypothetical protein